MKPFDWMVKYTPQTEWINRRGILLWLAFFFIELGAGMFLVASLINNILAMVTGWLLCAVLGGGFHLLFLGKPLRFWRMAISAGWKTSWISRGLIFVTFFLVLGAIHIGLSLGMVRITGLLIATDVFAFLAIIYGGFAMNYVIAIPLWNTALLPVLYVLSGLWGGAELTLGTALATRATNTGIVVEEGIRVLLMGFILILAVYFLSVMYGSLAGRVSVKQIVSGSWAPLMWIGVVVIGLAVPLSATITSYVVGLQASPSFLLYAAIIAGLVGDLSLRYLILRCSFYNPLIPSNVYS